MTITESFALFSLFNFLYFLKYDSIYNIDEQ